MHISKVQDVNVQTEKPEQYQPPTEETTWSRIKKALGPIGVVGVAYDGSAEARAAVLAAAELARGLDAELVLIGFVVPGEYDLDGAVDGQAIVRDVREELDAMVAELPGSTATDVMLRTG